MICERKLAEHLRLIDRLESKHALPVKNGFVKPTSEFLRELKTELGLDTVAQAWTRWMAVTEWRDEIAKREQANAELAFWFHINPYDLTDGQRVAFLANLERCKAQKTIHEGNYSPTNHEYVYSLFKLATGDEKLAIKARGDAMEALVNATSGG